MIRGLTAVEEIWPKALDVRCVPGSLNCGVLNALNISARNSMFEFSPNQRVGDYVAAESGSIDAGRNWPIEG